MLGDRLTVLGLWAIGEFVALLVVFWLVDGGKLTDEIRRYWPLALLGVLAVNGNLLFLFSLADRIRRLKPFFHRLSATTTRDVDRMYRQVAFGWSNVCWSLAICVALGYATFGSLGVATSDGIAIVIYVWILPAFGLLGVTIGFIINVWQFLWKTGKSEIRLRILHPDMMGGLGPVGELNTITLYGGGALLVVYSTGSHLMPYIDQEHRSYAYAWIGAAIVLYGLGLFLPTWTLHQKLRHEKSAAEARLEEMKSSLFQEAEACAAAPAGNRPELGEAESFVNVVHYLEEFIERVSPWPHGALARTILGLASIQGIGYLLQSLSELKSIIK
jgi:hypothetical protein